MDGWIEVFARRKINCKRGEVPSFTVLSIFAPVRISRGILTCYVRKIYPDFFSNLRTINISSRYASDHFRKYSGRSEVDCNSIFSDKEETRNRTKC